MDTVLSSKGYKRLRQIVLFESHNLGFKAKVFLPRVLAMGNVSVETDSYLDERDGETNMDDGDTSDSSTSFI